MSQETIDDWGKMLKSRNVDDRISAAKALGEFGPRASSMLSELLSTVLSDPIDKVRLAAIEAVVAIEEDQNNLESILIDQLSNNNWQVRMEAAKLLSALDHWSESTADKLWQALIDEKKPEVYSSIIRAILKIEYRNDLIARCNDFLRNKGTAEAKVAISIFNAIGLDTEFSEETINLLWETFRTADILDDVKIMDKVFRLVVQSVEDKCAVLRKLINDADISPHRKGRFALHLELRNCLKESFELDPSAAVQVVLPVLNDTDWRMRLDAVEWIQNRSDTIPSSLHREVVEALEELRDREDETLVITPVQQTLKALRPREREMLMGLLKSLHESVDETDQIDAINGIVQLRTLEALRNLIGEWVGWIESGEKTRHVEVTADAVRYSSHAVLPLVDHLPLARKVEVRRRITRQIAEMSDPNYYSNEYASKFIDIKNAQIQVKNELVRHAIPPLVRCLSDEEDLVSRENVARALANLSADRRAVDALVQAVVGEERKRAARQTLLNDYYLKPSRKRSEEAAAILNEAVKEAKRTLWTLRMLNVVFFSVAMVVFLVSFAVFLWYTDASTRALGLVSSISSLIGAIILFIREPLDRIQNSMADLVQLETAFTSFIWELNLNSTFIQSQYVAEGVLQDKLITNTIHRIEHAMDLAMSLVAEYTKAENQQILTRITGVTPAASVLGEKITIHGRYLFRTKSQGAPVGMIAVNHVPIAPDQLSWKEHWIEFTLPTDLPHVEPEDRTVFLSLFVDGMETNAIPFHILRNPREA